MSPELAALQHELTLLHGQIDGALASLQLWLGIAGALLLALVGVCSYVFISLAKAHRDTERTVHKVDKRVAELEGWRREHTRLGAG